MDAAKREAACTCGQLRITCEGEPDIVAVCHCLECQRRTGSVFSVQAWFPKERVAAAGEARHHARRGDSGRTVDFRFCPGCGGTVFWEAEFRPGLVAVAVGAFADPGFPPPGRSGWDERRHPWTARIRVGD